MHRTPDIGELRAVFNGPHTALDPLAPEEYSPHRFEHTQDNERVVCEICAADGELRVIWWHQDRLLMDVSLQGLKSLDISRSGNVTLIGNADFRDIRYMFKLQLQPHICWHMGLATVYGD